MKYKRIVLVILFVFLTSATSATEFWPEGSGLSWEFSSSSNSTTMRQMIGDSGAYSLGFRTETSSAGISLEIDGDGNVVVTSFTRWSAGGFDADMGGYSPPLILIRFPLTVGDHWVSFGSGTSILCEVLREDIVQVPAGEFEVVVVRVTDLANFYDFDGDYYLNETVGPVIVPRLGELVTFTGSVPLTEKSWGSVKALFR